jgi:hypothetical protein
VLPTSTYVCMQVSVGRYIRTRVTYLHLAYWYYDRQIGKKNQRKEQRHISGRREGWYQELVQAILKHLLRYGCRHFPWKPENTDTHACV